MVSIYIQFSKTFVVDFRFEEVQTLKFAVYDVDDKHNIDDIRRHDFIGAMECSLADIVAAGQQYKRTLRVSGKYVRSLLKVEHMQFLVVEQLPLILMFVPDLRTICHAFTLADANHLPKSVPCSQNLHSTLS